MDGAHLGRLFGLEGKVAVVTGAAENIGKATARLFADAGAKLALADCNLPGAAALAKEIGSGSIALQFDQANDASIVAMINEVAERLGRIDILVNNAGIFPRYEFHQLTEAQFQEMLRINTWGCFVALREAARVMRASKRGGRVINVSSIGGLRTAVDNQIAYNASKAALDSITLSAALELARDGILVNSVLPAAVQRRGPPSRVSPAPQPPASGPLMNPGRILLGRYGDLEEIVGPILMLASNAGAYMTGQHLVIDGGFSIS
jgi:NAD(P)-dependent dehydrogenase (short-subunit alcohol dehydrogenase family)